MDLTFLAVLHEELIRNGPFKYDQNWPSGFGRES